MFEAKLTEALVLKKIVEAIKDLVTDVNIDALGSMGFEEYRAMTLGISVTNLAKVLKLASNEDKLILRLASQYRV